MRIKVNLLGNLKPDNYEPIFIEADTPLEVVKSLSYQLDTFKANVITGYKRVKIVGFDTVESLITPLTEVTTELTIVPQFNGGKQGGFFQIIIGAALIAASFLPIPGMQAFAPFLWKLGAMMILGGLLQLISAPQRERSKTESEENKSFFLSSPRNTVEIGTRIPILYGRRKIGGHYLSFNISAVDTGI